jgi:hypothetical protein
MISTGVSGIDDMLGGGIARGSRVLYSMDPGVDGQLFMLSGISAAIKKGLSCLVIIPHTTVSAFCHDATALLGDGTDLHSKNMVFLDAIDRERIQRTAPSPDSARQEWKSRISKIAKEYKVDIVFAYFDLIDEEFGVRNGLELLDSARGDRKPTLVIEHLNLEGAALPERFISEFSFDLVIAIRASSRPLPHFTYFTLFMASPAGGPARSVPFTLTGNRIVPYIPRIVVMGPPGSGKSMFVGRVSDHRSCSDGVMLNSDDTIAEMDLGWLRWKDFDIAVYGTPSIPEFDPMIPTVLRNAMGVVLLIDAADPASFTRARNLIAMVNRHNLPMIVAANKKDLQGKIDETSIRRALGIQDKIPVVSVTSTKKQDVDTVLESLVDYITRFPY